MRTAARVFIVVVLALIVVPTHVRAALTSCTVSVSPSSATRNTTIPLIFSITNGSATNISWIKITRPSPNFTVTDGSATGWTPSHDDENLTLTGGSLSSSDPPLSVTVDALAADTEAGGQSWLVTANDDGGGSAIPCEGNTEVSIVSPSAPVTPLITDIVVSGISDTQATISWTTDISSNSIVDYGTTMVYGQTKSDSSMTTSHGLTISGLTANTTYHYDVSSTDASGNGSDAGDNTFVTAVAGTTTTTTTGSVRTVTATPTPTPRPDTSPPKVTVTTDLTKPFKVAPTIKGTATDPSGVATLEYSLDNGKSWLPVNSIASVGKTSTAFEFTPESLLDDNYQVKIRAVDLKGNSGETAVGTLVVDRLPPRMGGSVTALGPQILSPSPDGSYIVSVGLDIRLTVSAVGGPTTIDLGYPGLRGDFVNIPLTKNSDNGLWNGVLRFDAAGSYVVTARAVDGAGNRAERDIATFVALPNGKVTGGGQTVRSGRLTVYYLDTLMKRFVLWDGSSYGQVNPQPLTSDGQYTLYLPPGTYYVDVSAPGYQSLVTNMFTLSDAGPVTTNFSLTSARAIRIFSWFIPLPDFRQTTATVRVASQSGPTTKSPLVGHEFPYFHLTAGTKTITSFDLRGKPTIITFLNTWLPATTTQMTILNDVAAKKDINVLVIIPQETASSVYIFSQRGEYSLPIAADPDGELVDPLNLHSLPTHVILDRKGIIIAVQSGVFNKEELFDMIIQ